MKKFIVFILATALVLTLVSCAPAPTASFRIAALKGATGMGLVSLMDKAQKGEYQNSYESTIYGTADEIVPKLINGEIDVALIPANLAAVLYTRTSGEIRIAAVNTLGVLYVLENGDTVKSVADLKGKTIYSTGKGTTPEYALNYILQKNGLDPTSDLTIEFKSEASEIASLLAEGTPMVAVLPQPYVTTVTAKNSNVRVALSFEDEWNAVANGESRLVTGVAVVRNSFYEQNKAAFEQFLTEYEASIRFALNNPDDAAVLCETFGIVGAAVAKKAIPECNLTFLTGDEMRSAVLGYLGTLYASNPNSVGGKAIDEGIFLEK